MRIPFDTYPDDVRRFYINLLNNANINLYAVRHGYFDTLLSDFTDDINDLNVLRWRKALPKIIEQIQLDNNDHQK